MEETNKLLHGPPNGRKESDLRGLGRQPNRTKKCTCETPFWTAAAVRESRSGELIITLYCSHCKAYWDTKSLDARQYVTSHDNLKIVQAADRHRVTFLESLIERYRNEQKKLERKISKAQKEWDALREYTINEIGKDED